MSENNKNKPELIITEAELVTPKPYDFEFIAHTLGLIPYQALGDDDTIYQGALNPGAIINFEITEEGHGAFMLHGGEQIVMEGNQLAAFENTLKRKIEEANVKQREAMLAMQGGGLVGIPTGRKFRQ